jgi:hypothetical protein
VINTTNVSAKSVVISDEEQEYNSIFKSNKKHIFWKLTEDGLIYCSRNCLISNRIKQNIDLIPKVDSVDASSQINKNEKILIYNKSNSGQHLVSSIPNLQKITQTIDSDEIDSLTCIPYSNHTSYDFLKSFSKRFQLNGEPEPDLITMFDRNSKLDLETLRQRLIEMKKEVLE